MVHDFSSESFKNMAEINNRVYPLWYTTLLMNAIQYTVAMEHIYIAAVDK
jgi:hypothetical protein